MRLILVLSLFSAVLLAGCSSYGNPRNCGYRCANNGNNWARCNRCYQPNCRGQACAPRYGSASGQRVAQYRPQYQPAPAQRVVTRKAAATRAAPVVRQVARPSTVRRTPARFIPPPPPCIPESTTVRAQAEVPFSAPVRLEAPAVVTRPCPPAPVAAPCVPASPCSPSSYDPRCPGGNCSVPGLSAACPGGNCSVPGLSTACPGGNCSVPGINACVPPAGCNNPVYKTPCAGAAK